MNTTQWEDSWNQDMAEMDAVSVKLERMKHNTDVWLEELDRQDAETAAPKRRTFLRALMGGAQ